MKKIYVFFISVSLCLITLLAQAFSVSAVEVNMKQATVGDVITYEIHAANCPKNVAAIDVRIYYDNAALQYVEDSIKIPNLSGYLVNTDLEGEIRFNVADLTGFDFQADKILAELQFKVISDYNPYPKLNYEVKDFLDIDLTNHTDTYVYDLTYVDYEVAQFEENSSRIKEESKIESDMASSSVLSSRLEELSDTDSKSSQKGEESSALTEIDTVSDESRIQNSNNLSIDTVDTADSITDNSNTEKQSHFNFLYILIPLVIAVLVLVIFLILFIIFRSKSDGNHMN